MGLTTCFLLSERHCDRCMTYEATSELPTVTP